MTYNLNPEAKAFSYTREELFTTITKIVAHPHKTITEHDQSRALAIMLVFDDWDVEPDQEGFESLVVNELFDKIHYEMGGPASPMPYTKVEQLEDVEIDFDWEEDDE